MTAKEKAIELTGRFEGYENEKVFTRRPILCAIRCVNELKKELTLLQINESHDAWVVSRYNFWDEVIKELNKL